MYTLCFDMKWNMKKYICRYACKPLRHHFKIDSVNTTEDAVLEANHLFQIRHPAVRCKWFCRISFTTTVKSDTTGCDYNLNQFHIPGNCFIKSQTKPTHKNKHMNTEYLIIIAHTQPADHCSSLCVHLEKKKKIKFKVLYVGKWRAGYYSYDIQRSNMWEYLQTIPITPSFY